MDIRYLEIGENLRLAYRHREGRGPTIVFLPGYMSDMDGGKSDQGKQRVQGFRRSSSILTVAVRSARSESRDRR